MSIAKLVVHLRKQLGWNQTVLATRSESSFSTIRNLEKRTVAAETQASVLLCLIYELGPDLDEAIRSYDGDSIVDLQDLIDQLEVRSTDRIQLNNSLSALLATPQRPRPSDTISSLFLSGWEYNRLLQDDPLTPRNSALPGELLWKGASSFWLFETVYCTEESLKNEQEACELLDWTTGEIFVNLHQRQLIQTFNWQTANARIRREVRASHEKLRSTYDPDTIREYIRNGETYHLELIKQQLLNPIANHLGCFQAQSPNSLPTWKVEETGQFGDVKMEAAVMRLNKIVDAVQNRRQPIRAGIQLCDVPGTDVSPDDREQQAVVQRDVEGPMINDLLSGEGDFAGPTGYRPYLERLEPYKDAYNPINDQLRLQWEQNRDTLFRLRDVARKYLWEPLHQEWLPRLVEEGEFFGKDFDRSLTRALEATHFQELFNRNTNLLFAPRFRQSHLAAIGFFGKNCLINGLIEKYSVSKQQAFEYIERLTDDPISLDLQIFIERAEIV